MWRRLVILLAALAGAFGGAAFALKSELVADNLRRHAERLALQRFGIELRVGTLAIDLWPLRLRFTDVVGVLPGQAVPLFTLGRGAAEILPWPAPSGAVVVDELDLEDLRLTVALAALGHGGEGGARAALRSPVDVRALRLRGLDLDLTGRGWRLTVSHANVGLEPDLDGRRDLDLAVPAARFERAGKGFDVAAQLQASLRGTLDRPEALNVSRMRLVLEDLVLQAGGAVTLQGTPDLDLVLEGAAALSRLRELWPGMPAVTGDSRFTLAVRGPPAAPDVRVRLAVAGLGYGGVGLGDLEVDGRLERERLRLDSFRLAHARGGKVTGGGVLELAAGSSLTAKLRLHDVSLPVTLELAGLTDAWVDGRASGAVDVHGALEPFGLAAAVALNLEGFRVLDRSFREIDPTEILHLGTVEAAGKVLVGTQAVVVEDLSLTRGSSRTRVQGTLHYDPNAGMDLRVASDDIHLADLGVVAFLGYGGRGTLAGAVEGPYADPTISVTLGIDQLAVDGYAVGDARATVFYSGLVLRIDRASGKRGGGTFEGSGRIDFRSDAITAEAQAELRQVSLADLLATLHVPPEVTRRLSARTSGSLRLTGPLLSPLVTVALAAPSLAVNAADLGALRLEAQYAGSTGRAWVSVETAADAGAVRAKAAVAAGGDLVVDAELRGMSLAALAPLLGDLDVVGRASGTVRLAGPPAALTGRIEVSTPALVSYDTHLGETRLVGDVADGEVAVTGTTLAGRAGVEGRVRLSRRAPYAITVRFDDTKLASLWPGLGALDATATGSLFSQGQLTEPDTILAEVTIDVARATLFGVPVSLARAARLQYAHGVLRVADAGVAGPGLRASLLGSTAIDGTLDLMLSGSAELEAARPTVWRVTGQRGLAAFRLSLTGTWAVPYINGEVTLTDGVLRLRDGGQSAEGASGRLAFNGRSISVDGFSARTGGGQLSIVGQIALPPGRDPAFDLRAELDEVTWRPDPQLTVTARGGLRLSGGRRDLSISGDLEVESLRYSANIDLERLIPRRNAPPLRVPALDPDAAVRLGVRLSATNDVLVTSPVLEAELQADLVLTGTTDRLGVVGSVTPLWARARYQDNLFTVERASILFTDEYRVAAEYDLRARTEACGMQITVDIRGDSDGYSFVPNGADEAGPASSQDVLACLQLGVRLRDLRGLEGGVPSGMITTSSLDALWAVSGLDQQVRRIFPIVDELRLSSGWSARVKRTTPRVVVGKELGKDLQLTYSRSLDLEYEQVLSVQYRVNGLATMLGTWSTATDAQLGDFGLDLRLRWEFQ